MSEPTIHPKLAFLGIGLMGKPMASRLVKSGHDVTVWNRTPDKAEALGAIGARVVRELGQAVADAEIVISMLEAGPVVASLIDQAVSTLRPGSIWVDMSSTKPSEARHFHAVLAARGVSFVDAPVSGGVIGAEAGTLAIMAGGSPADYSRVQPLLAALGKPVLVGPNGCGQLSKLCNQLIVGGTLGIVAEALLLAEAGGADPAAVRTAMRNGFAESRILEVHGQRMLDRHFLPGGQVKSQAKDLHNILDAAASAGLSLPLTTVVTECYDAILDDVPNADQSAVLLAIERLNPGKRLGKSEDQLP